MEVLEKIMFVVVAIVCVLIIILMAWNFLKIPDSQGKITIEGNKTRVINQVTSLIYRCFDENMEKKVSIICSRVDFKSDQEIFSSDILNSINPSRIDKKDVIVEDLGLSGKIIIRYENQSIYVKKVEIEGTSS